MLTYILFLGDPESTRIGPTAPSKVTPVPGSTGKTIQCTKLVMSKTWVNEIHFTLK